MSSSHLSPDRHTPPCPRQTTTPGTSTSTSNPDLSQSLVEVEMEVGTGMKQPAFQKNAESEGEEEITETKDGIIKFIIKNVYRPN